MNKILQKIFLLLALTPSLLPSFAQNECADLQITSGNSQLTIAGITAPNLIVKVFDHNWQIVMECGADCEETIILSDLTVGEIYHTDVQFYDANWHFICDDRQNIEIMGGIEPCDQSICNGDVILKTQAEVDAYCACEVIKGSVQIGGFLSNANIIDISTFSNVKRIEGKLEIFNTALEDLTGLEQVEYLGDGLQVSYNGALKSFDGLNNLSSITLLEIRDNDQLKEFNTLASLTSAERAWVINNNSLVGLGGLSNIDYISVNLIISGNPSLSDLKDLNKLEAVGANGLKISTNAGLESFNGLENLKRVEGTVQILDNVKLKSIADLSNLTQIFYFLIIDSNPQLVSLDGLENLSFWNKISIKNNTILSDCCAISHILNPDGVNSFIEIDNNPAFCSSVEEIIANCQGTPSLCDRVIISSEENQLSIEGIVVPNHNIRIYDHNWQLAFECSTNCEETIFLSYLTAGEIYHTDIQFYDANWHFICGDQQDIEINGGSEPCDTIACQGDVILTTQAEVDAFCGCEVIMGDVTIGNSAPNNGQETDISNLSSFLKTKKIEGSLILGRTQITDFSGFNNLREIGNSLTSVFNKKLENFNGFNKLEKINNLVIIENPVLLNFDDLENLSSINDQVYIENNSSLNSLLGLTNIKKLKIFGIIKNPSLTSFQGLNNLDSVYQVGNIDIRDNDGLTSLDGLGNLKKVTNLTLVNNPLLSDCCSITHLVDADPNNGQVLGEIIFHENPSFCNSVEGLLAHCQASSSCADLQITSANNQLTIIGITAPNPIVKVFDQNWQLVFECNANCDQTIILSDLNTGEIYHTDVQFYGEDWQFICDSKQNIEIIGDPCATICQGDVLLLTQAEVDAFCGCEVIEGALNLGSLTTNQNHIFDISNLSAIKNIKGGLTIVNTKLVNLEGLENLIQVEELALIDNEVLSSVKGLEKLKWVNSHFILIGNKQLTNIDNLIQLERIGGQIVIESNPALKSINGLSKIKKATFIFITSNQELINIDGLVNIDSIVIFENSISGLSLAGNPKLVDITSLRGLKFVASDMVISTNQSLEDCCSILHLIDDNPDNGQVLGSITIADNLTFCNSVEEILAHCTDTPPFSCDNIQIETSNNELTISGLSAPIEIVKVFDENWQLIFDCFANCEESINLTGLVGNTFHIQITSYDENWKYICQKDQDISLSQDRNSGLRQLEAADFLLNPNPALEDTYIDLKALKGEAVTLKMYNQFGKKVYQKQIEKVVNTKEKIALSSFSNGLYLLHIQTKGRKAVAKKLMISRLY